jgi:hypothetical protein
MIKLPALVLALGLTGCFIIEPDPVPCSLPTCVPPEPPPPDTVEVMTVTPNLDVLFVIDDSPTMIDKQRSFQNAFPALLEALAQAPGGTPNLHLAVVSSDMGTSALGDALPGAPIGAVGQGGCANDGKAGRFQLGQAVLPDQEDRFLIATRDGSKNFTGTLSDTFGQLSSLGAQGCGFEQHLAAAQTALSGPIENTGFLREGANLAVIVLADEDDCSAEHTTLFGPDGGPMGPLQSFRCFRFGIECDQDIDTLGPKTNCRPAASSTHVASVDPFAEFLAGLKPDPSRVLFGAVIGDTTTVEVETRTLNGQTQIALAPGCRFQISGGTAEASADPGLRFSALAGNFEGNSIIESICSEDLTNAAANLGNALAGLMDSTCLPSQRQELDCFVEDRRDAEPGVVNRIDACTTGGGVGANCFRFDQDSSCPSGQRLSIARPIPPRGDEWSVLRCRQ